MPQASSPRRLRVSARSLTGLSGAFTYPLPHGRGSDRSPDRKGGVSRKSTILRGRGSSVQCSVECIAAMRQPILAGVPSGDAFQAAPVLGLRAHDAGRWAHAAVRAVAVRAVRGCAFGARHFALVESDQSALVVFNRTRVLTDIAGVINAAGQFAEIALFNGFEGAYADLGGFGDLLERDAPIAANCGQTQDAFFLYHLPAPPGINL